MILDNVGTAPLLDFRRVMKPDGIFVIVGGGGPNDGKLIGPMARPLQGLLLAPFVSQQFVMLLADINDKDLQFISDLIAAKKAHAGDRPHLHVERSAGRHPLSRGGPRARQGDHHRGRPTTARRDAGHPGESRHGDMTRADEPTVPARTRSATTTRAPGSSRAPSSVSASRAVTQAASTSVPSGSPARGRSKPRVARR